MDTNDWSKFKNLSNKTKQNLAPTTEFNKSAAIQNIYKVQDKIIQEAKQSGDKRKMHEADRFASALHREQAFIRHSK